MHHHSTRTAAGISAALLAVLLAACNDSDTKAEPVSGILEARASGVSYTTPTQSGVVEANGAFTYLPGETVTFTVGGVPLGSAPGAPKITLFTLAGLTPPSTERHLRRELDLALRNATPFTRAVNMQLFLMMLDADSNPANGCEVGGRATALATARLDFSRERWEFAAELQRQVPNLTRDIPAWTPVAELYRSISLAVPAHAVASVSDPLTIGPWNPAAYFYEHDARGLRMQELADADGLPGGAADITTYTYDAMLRRTSTRFEYLRGFPSIHTDAATRDARGNVLSSIFTADQGGDGAIDMSQQATLTWNEFGELLRQDSLSDSDADGTVDSQWLYVATIEDRNLSQSNIESADFNFDGRVDQIIYSHILRNDRSRPLSYVTREDWDADGSIDQRRVQTYTYSGSVNPVRSVYEADYDNDGLVDRSETTDITVDSHGNPLTQRSVTRNADVAEWLSTTTHTYDAQKRRLSSITESDYFADGSVEGRSTMNSTYDALGNLLTRATAHDSDGNGTWDITLARRYTYGADGELLRIESGSDANRDGQPDTVTATSNYTHRVFADGVTALAQQYFDGQGGVIAAATP
jgi:hypothetical protein